MDDILRRLRYRLLALVLFDLIFGFLEGKGANSANGHPEEWKQFAGAVFSPKAISPSSISRLENSVLHVSLSLKR